MQNLAKCYRTWIETLEFFGIVRKLNPREEVEIARSVQLWGSEFVDMALYGARFEPATKDFNPKNHISLGRILSKKDGVDRIDKFANLGAAQIQINKVELEKKVLQKSRMETERTDPGRVREIMSGMFKRTPQ